MKQIVKLEIGEIHILNRYRNMLQFVGMFKKSNTLIRLSPNAAQCFQQIKIFCATRTRRSAMASSSSDMLLFNVCFF